MSRTRLVTAVAASAATLAAVLLPVAPAQASRALRIDFSTSGVYARTGPSLHYATSGSKLANGTVVTVACEARGLAVTNRAKETTTLWERLADGRWVPNAFVATGTAGRTHGIPGCGYDAGAAVRWAKAHVSTKETFKDNDCAWFLSHALWAGGRSMTKSWTEDGSSREAKNADAFARGVASRGHGITKVSWRDNTAGGSRVGDVIAYDWDGNAVIDHVALVTRLTSKGYPYVAQHSPAQADRYWSWSALSKKWIQDVHPHARAYRVRP